MKYVDSILPALKEVFRDKKYWGLAVGFTFIAMAFNLLVTNFSLLKNQFSIGLFFTLLFGSMAAMPKFSLSLLVIMAILGGVVTSMSIFLVTRQVSGAAAGSSVLLAVIAPACPSCAIGPLAALGLGGYLAVLPFRGVEIGILGLVVLVGALLFLSTKITTKICGVKK